jgi:hypothetical protein
VTGWDDDAVSASIQPGAPAAAPVALWWQPEVADYTEALALRAGDKRTTLKLLLIALACLLGAVTGALTKSWTVFGAGSGGAVAVIGIRLLQPLMIRRYFTRTEALHQPVQAYLSATGIDSRTALSSGQWPWTSIAGALEGKRCYVVQMHGHANQPFLPLAKRGAPDPAAAAALHAWLAPYLKTSQG